MEQGRLIRRGKIPKNSKGEFWHWKDLNIGKDLVFYGKVFHTADCDLFTKVRNIVNKTIWSKYLKRYFHKQQCINFRNIWQVRG